MHSFRKLLYADTYDPLFKVKYHHWSLIVISVFITLSIHFKNSLSNQYIQLIQSFTKWEPVTNLKLKSIIVQLHLMTKRQAVETSSITNKMINMQLK